MEQAEPISAWQPHSAPEMEAFVLMRSPITPPAASARTMSSSEKPRSSCIYSSAAGITPLEPHVGAVTISPPEAFCSATANAYAQTSRFSRVCGLSSIWRRL